MPISFITRNALKIFLLWVLAYEPEQPQFRLHSKYLLQVDNCIKRCQNQISLNHIKVDMAGKTTT